MADDVQAGGAFVVAVGHEPRRPRRVGGGHHFVTGAGIVVPAAVGLGVHGRKFPDFARVCDSVFQTAFLFFHIDFQPIFEQDDAAVGERLFKKRHDGQKFEAVFFGAETHHALHAGPVVPASVEDDDFACGRQVRNVALQVNLAFFPFGGCGEGDGAEDARADAFGNRFDCATLSRAVPPFEDNADFQAFALYPALQGDQFAMQILQFSQVFFQADFGGFAFGFLVHFSVSFDYAGHPIRYNGFFCLPCASKLSSDSQSRKRRLRSGHSLSITEYQLVSRLRPRLMRSWRKVPS